MAGIKKLPATRPPHRTAANPPAWHCSLPLLRRDKPGVWLGPSEHTPPENAAPGAPHAFILLPTGLAPFPQLPVESRIYSVIEFQPRFYGECNGVNFSNAGGSWKGSPVETQTWDSRQLSEKPLRSPLLAKMQPGRKLITQC